MDLGIAGRKAIVCASSRGIGRACAHKLAEAGCEVVINGRDEAALAATAKAIADATGAKVIPVAADVSTPDGQQAILAACPTPDILVNNNGGPPFREFREIDRAAMLDGVTMNMVTPIELINAVIDHMTGQRFGRIVNVTSVSVRMPIQGLDLSSGARAGLTAFLAGVARKVAGQGVTINHILPGYIDTDRFRAGVRVAAQGAGRTEEEVAAERATHVPVGRIGSPDEMGAACAFLCSTHAAYITGQSLLIDGGLYNSAF